jgi:uncharacterized SAM-binding protein YcdF (DUF218 family)
MIRRATRPSVPMTFVITKILRMLVAPGNAAVLLLAWGVLRLLGSRGQRGRGLVAAVAAALLLVAVLPVGRWALMPLEARFPTPILPADVDGLILLGGAIDARIVDGHAEPTVNAAADRLFAFTALARRYPRARLLLTGGEAAIVPSGYNEADLSRDLLIEEGIDPGRIVVEARSRNTIENAIYSRTLVEPQPGETWVLVTSAAHMPRAIGCFRHAGWPVIAFPADFRGGDGGWWDFALVQHLGLLELATKEWLGLVGYRVFGRIDTVFPGP